MDGFPGGEAATGNNIPALRAGTIIADLLPGNHILNCSPR